MTSHANSLIVGNAIRLSETFYAGFKLPLSVFILVILIFFDNEHLFFKTVGRINNHDSNYTAVETGSNAVSSEGQ